MPSLNWLGKDAVLNHHLDVPYKTLELKDSFNCEKGSSENKIIHGDNLEALKALMPEYEGKMKCIYIDPPYNTGNENWVYNDNVNSPKIRKWLGQVVGKEAEDLTRHDKWLCMMYPRLKLLHKLLREDGAIFISIDDNEQANLKLMCDEIFGAGNFVGNIIWQKRKGGGNDSFFFGVDHEYVVCYVKNTSCQKKKWRVPYEKDYLKRYKYEDEKGPYYFDTLSRPGLNNPIVYDVVCPDGSIIKNGTWQVSKETFNEEIKSGEIDFIKSREGSYTVVRKVRIPKDGKVFRSIFSDVSNKDAADEMFSLFHNKKEFSTPKPKTFVETILKIISDPNSIILDSFAGSGTTAHAVLNLNKRDGGNRKFILVEMEDYADNITAERVRRVIKGYGTGKNIVEGTGGDFNYYELGPEMLLDGSLNEEQPLENIRNYIYYTETNSVINAADVAKNGNEFFLGNHDNAAYYLFYKKTEVTTLDVEFLGTISQKAERYVIYADNCVLPKDFLFKNNIVFKKIPRDVRRF